MDDRLWLFNKTSPKRISFDNTKNDLRIIGSNLFNPMKKHYDSFIGSTAFYHDA